MTKRFLASTQAAYVTGAIVPIDPTTGKPSSPEIVVTHLMEGVVDVGTGAGARKRGFKRRQMVFDVCHVGRHRCHRVHAGNRSVRHGLRQPCLPCSRSLALAISLSAITSGSTL